MYPALMILFWAVLCCWSRGVQARHRDAGTQAARHRDAGGAAQGRRDAGGAAQGRRRRGTGTQGRRRRGTGTQRDRRSAPPLTPIAAYLAGTQAARHRHAGGANSLLSLSLPSLSLSAFSPPSLLLLSPFSPPSLHLLSLCSPS